LFEHPASFPVDAGEVRLHGALIEIDEKADALRDYAHSTNPGRRNQPPSPSRRSTTNSHRRRNRRDSGRFRRRIVIANFELFGKLIVNNR